MPKKEVIYFSHDSNSRNDPKVLKLRLRLKMDGYGVYWCLVEMLREQTDFRLPLDYEAIAFSLSVCPILVERVINEFDLFRVDSDCFYSESLIRRMDEMREKKDYKSKKAKESADLRWEKERQKSESKNEPIEKPKNNPANKLDFEQIKLNFQKQRIGQNGNKPYFNVMQDVYDLSEKEILGFYDKWSSVNQNNTYSEIHAQRSFNIFIQTNKENKNGIKKTGKQPQQNGSNQLSDIYEAISGIHK